MGGGICDNHHIFDYEYFDQTAKEWIEDKNINRKALIDRYANVLDTQKSAEKRFLNLTENTNSVLRQLQKRYKTNYMVQKPKVKIDIEDHSGFYHNEPLVTLVTFKHNRLDMHPIDFTKSYQPIVENVFPCMANEECLQNLSNAKQTIMEDSQKRIKEIKKREVPQASKEYEMYLKKQTSKINIIADYNEQQITTKNKTLFYHLKKMPEKISSDKKSVTATYVISSASFKDIFPEYRNSDKNIAISFDPKKVAVIITNKTDQFIEIGSISLYYNDTIYKVSNDKTQNFVSELSPNATRAMNALPVWSDVKESHYKNVTYHSIKNRTISFGLAIKYTTLQPSKRYTLYKLNTYNLAKLLQQY